MRGNTEARIRAHVANFGSEDEGLYRRGRRYVVHYGSRTFETLVEATTEGTMLHRCRAVMGLGYIRDPRGFEVLVPLLDDPLPEVRYDAGVALGLLGDLRAVPILLEKRRLTDSDDEVEQIIAYGAWDGLGQFGTAAIPALLAALPTAPAVDRAAIAFFLDRSEGDPQVLAALQELLSDTEPSVREAAAESIKEIESRLRDTRDKPTV